jgi:TAP42-like family
MSLSALFDAAQRRFLAMQRGERVPSLTQGNANKEEASENSTAESLAHRGAHAAAALALLSRAAQGISALGVLPEDALDADDVPARSLRFLLLNYYAAELALEAPPGALEAVGFAASPADSAASSSGESGDAEDRSLHRRELSGLIEQGHAAAEARTRFERRLALQQKQRSGGSAMELEQEREKEQKERLVRLQSARQCALQFLRQLEALGLLHAADVAFVDALEEEETKAREEEQMLNGGDGAVPMPAMFGAGGDPRKKREEKVNRGRRQMAANQRLRALMAKKDELRKAQRSVKRAGAPSAETAAAASVDLDDVPDEDGVEEEMLEDALMDEEDTREFWLTQIEVASTRAVETLQVRCCFPPVSKTVCRFLKKRLSKKGLS